MGLGFNPVLSYSKRPQKIQCSAITGHPQSTNSFIHKIIF
jgi:hypothetical protein